LEIHRKNEHAQNSKTQKSSLEISEEEFARSIFDMLLGNLNCELVTHVFFLSLAPGFSPVTRRPREHPAVLTAFPRAREAVETAEVTRLPPTPD
jgi:hypothetical protein